MINERRHKIHDTKITEWITCTPNDLDDIGVGLAGILDDGRYGFGLEGSELIDFVRRSLYVLEWPRPASIPTLTLPFLGEGFSGQCSMRDQIFSLQI
jgi:hypothetical protein